MPGLNNLLSNTDQTTTTAPAWYTNAQQGAAGQAGQAAAQTPGLSDTTGQLAVNNLNDPNNSFAQGQGSLNAIAEGAANPWLTDASGVQTPNTATPIGGLFNAQRNYFNQILPNVAAPADAQSISGGNFGSLRGLTARDKAVGDAYNQLITQQNQAALQNQATGVQAGAGLANLGQLQNQAQINTAQFQQAAPFAASTGYSNVLKNVSPIDQTQRKQVQLSPLNQVGTVTDALASLLGVGGNTNLNANQLSAIERQYNIPAGTLSRAVNSGGVLGNVSSIGSWLSTQWGRLTGPSQPDVNTSSDGTRVITGTDGSVVSMYTNGYQSIVRPDGSIQFYDSNGNPITQDEANRVLYSENNNPNAPTTPDEPDVTFPDYNTPANNQPVDPGDYDPPDYNVPPSDVEGPI